MSGMAIRGGRPDFRNSENEAIPFTAPERGTPHQVCIAAERHPTAIGDRLMMARIPLDSYQPSLWSNSRKLFAIRYSIGQVTHTSNGVSLAVAQILTSPPVKISPKFSGFA